MRAIITFHSIDNSGSVLSFSPQLFDALLAALAQAQVPVLSMADLLADEHRAGVALTFDDGMRSVYTDALPILRAYGATAHIFVTTGAVNKAELWPPQPAIVPGFAMLNWDELAQLQAAGITIDAHTCMHPNMRELSRQQMQDECTRADDEIERRLGHRPQFFAYPFGFHNQLARDYIRGHYQATVTTELAYLKGGEDRAALPRLDSYYLQSAWRLRNLDSVALKTYITLRTHLRTLKGSQYRANCA